MPSKKHVHRYKKVKIGDNKREVMRCTYDDCSHILYDPLLARHRKSICWGCGNEFEIGIEVQVKPVCDSCKVKRKRPLDPTKLDSKVNEILDQYSPEELLNLIGGGKKG